MRKLDVQGDPIVVVENETHVLCVRSFPSDLSQPEYVVWRKDLDGNVSAGSYFPTFGSQVEAFAEALACFDARSKSDLRCGKELKEVRDRLESLGRDFDRMAAAHQSEVASLRRIADGAIKEMTEFRAKLRL